MGSFLKSAILISAGLLTVVGLDACSPKAAPAPEVSTPSVPASQPEKQKKDDPTHPPPVSTDLIEGEWIDVNDEYIVNLSIKDDVMTIEIQSPDEKCSARGVASLIPKADAYDLISVISLPSPDEDSDQAHVDGTAATSKNFCQDFFSLLYTNAELKLGARDQLELRSVIPQQLEVRLALLKRKR